eukprot:384664_1
MISKSASFLSYPDYFRFGQCNRTIYTSCYTSPQIHALRLSSPMFKKLPKSHSMIPFKNISVLSMNIKDFNAWSPSNQIVWSNNMNMIELDLFNGGGSHNDAASFNNNQHLINSDNITKLRLSNFNTVLVCDILSKFTRVQNLRLYNIEVGDDYAVDVADMVRWFPNLKDLSLNDVNAEFVADIMVAFQNQLQSLSIYDPDVYAAIPNTILIFPKLNSLNLWYPRHSDKFKKVPALKNATLVSDEEDIIKAFIHNMLAQQSLEYLNVQEQESDVISPTCMMKHAEFALVQFTNTGRNNDNLCIHFEVYSGLAEHDQIGLQIFRLTNALQVANIDKWCIKISVYNMDNDGIDTKHLMTVLDKLKEHYYVLCQIDEYEWIINVSNKN